MLANCWAKMMSNTMSKVSNMKSIAKVCAFAVLAWLLVHSAFAADSSNIQYLKVSREVIEARLQKYTGDDRRRENTLKQMFAEAGCDREHLSEQSVQGSSLPNVVCVLPGSTEKTIIVSAHFDHSPAGDGGVVDDWSGASLLPSLYQSVAFVPRSHTYVFVGFTDEERGAIGAQYYAQHLTKEQVAATEAMISMDLLGLGPVQIWAMRSDDHLIGELLYVAHILDFPVTGTNLDDSLNTATEGFAKRKIPRISIHTLTQETFDARIIHTPKDNLAAIQLDSYYDTYALLAAYVSFLDLDATVPPLKQLPPPAGPNDNYPANPPVFPPRRLGSR